MADMEGHRMQLGEFPRIIVEALCVHEAFRRLGYPSDDIYVIYGSPENPKHLSILVKWGQKEAYVNVGVLDMSADEFKALWELAIPAWNGASQEVAMHYWNTSLIRQNAVPFAVNLTMQKMLRRRLPPAWADWAQA